MAELNPNHPVTRGYHDQWHKLVALIMLKYGINPVFTDKEIVKLFEGKNGELAVVLDDRDGMLKIRLVPMAEAERLAREEGGLPA